LKVRDVVRTYEGKGEAATIHALRGVSLDLSAATVTALTGPSGSGKSTLLHLLGGMDSPDAGTIEADETAVSSLSRSRLVNYRRTVGFVFQHFALMLALTARDNVMVPVLPYPADFDKRERADELLDLVGLGGRENALPSQLSGGQQQRVAIARALINGPRLVLADEPTGNLDTATGAQIVDLLLGLREQRGVTIVLATHDPALAAQCDRAIQVRDGLIVD
jgi:putative ABC transport system ATP-binding protein